jgi:hypothetical protein
MPTQPDQTMPTFTTHFETYVDCRRAANFLSIDPKTVQRLSRAGQIPAHPILTGPRRRRTTWRYKLSELDRSVLKSCHHFSFGEVALPAVTESC